MSKIGIIIRLVVFALYWVFIFFDSRRYESIATGIKIVSALITVLAIGAGYFVYQIV